MFETVFLSTIFLYYKTKSLHCNTSPFWKGGGGIQNLAYYYKVSWFLSKFLDFYLNWGLEPGQPGCLYKKKMCTEYKFQKQQKM